MQAGKGDRKKSAPQKGTPCAAPEKGAEGPDVLRRPVTAIKGVGLKLAEALGARGIRSIEDLLYFIPTRHEDERAVRRICDIVEGEDNAVIATVTSSGTAYSRATRRKICHARVEDGSGALVVKWFRFNKGWMQGICRKGKCLMLQGKVSRYGAELQMVHPRVAVLGEGEGAAGVTPTIPVYREVAGVRQGVLRNIIEEAFRAYGSGIHSVIPKEVEVRHGLPDLKESLVEYHSLSDGAPGEGAIAPCVDRLIAEEFFLFQIGLFLRRNEARNVEGIAMRPGPCHAHCLTSLPFELTAAQKRVKGEIERDMAKPEPMNRLLQGDVGCGKTVCAVLAACSAIDSGCQVAIMAPTELLAEQHYLSVHAMLERTGVRPVLVRGKMGAERRQVLDAIARMEVQVVIGTHALLEDDVRFARLGLVVVDEQHRFGVIQRSRLQAKGSNPDILVMSATPIPRTLSMTVYGDLDVSVIGEMPRGRQKVVTSMVGGAHRDGPYRAIVDEIAQGRQVFVVYPILEESERLDLIGARESLTRLKARFPSYRIGLLHGKMKAEEKERTMQAFKEKEIDMLVCTTVVEVGIDVPNATLMIIEHAERFGLSQLHQLRGRVGRGTEVSRCFLVCAQKGSAQAVQRLRVLETTADGFMIAEEDMRLRGPGDMMGVRQAGIPDFRFGDLMKNGQLMSKARQMAKEALEDADAAQIAHFKGAIDRRWGEWLYLSGIA